MTTFAPGSVIRTRNRLWRVEEQPEDDVIVASTIDDLAPGSFDLLTVTVLFPA